MPDDWSGYEAALRSACRQLYGEQADIHRFDLFVRQVFHGLLDQELQRFNALNLAPELVELWHFVHTSGRHSLELQVRSAIQSSTLRTTCIDVLGEETPFLLNTLRMHLIRRGHRPLLVIDQSLAHAGSSRYRVALQIHIPEISDEACKLLQQQLEGAMFILGKVVQDFGLMRETLARESMQSLRFVERDQSKEENLEFYAFISWILQENMLLLGMKSWDIHDGQRVLRPDSELGWLAIEPCVDCLQEHDLFARPGYGRVAFAQIPVRSPVNHDEFCDLVALRRRDEQGQVVAELRLVGLYTSRMNQSDPANIPVMREKLATLRNLCGFHPLSADARNLERLLRFLPRNRLLMATASDLAPSLMSMVAQRQPRRCKFIWWSDRYDRFVYLTLFIPKTWFRDELPQQFLDCLKQTLDCRDTRHDVLVSAYLWVRVDYRLVIASATDDEQRRVMEERLDALCISWDQRVRCELEKLQVIIPEGQPVITGLAPEYQQLHAPEEAAEDLKMVLTLPQDSSWGLHLRQLDTTARRLKVVILHRGEPLWLSDVLPVVESLGLRVMDERSYELSLPAGKGSLHELQASWSEEGEIAQYEQLHGVMLACLQGRAPVDGFNRLALVAGLGADQIQVFRAYAYYQQQLGWAPGPSSVADLLVQHPDAVLGLWQRFAARWQETTDEQTDDLEGGWNRYLTTVSSRSADIVLRRYAALIDATVRCNYGRNHQGVLAFKLEPRRIAGVPRPCPLHEIYVYAHEYSGVHLRFGAIARGGIRWSDRQDDFRTEILGLVKAQQVKNAVIVPVGAKGGFVLHDPQRRLTVNSEAWRAAGVAVYESFMAALLALTDNQHEGQVVPVPGLRRHDGDDSYLVVAADKGTATFSDRANRISEAHGFWLGDAFASGGQHGYDHKVMGITARGAYLSLQRHLWTLGRQDEAFTCVGIGDMSGDVFGNGMLLAPQMRLLAAFNHAHIFIDPDPRVGRAYAERQRLFALPRSGWSDYDAACLSTGGAIYARSEKMIEVSPQARAALDLPAGPLSPDALIQGLLRAPVDVIWNGGIGTYIKSTQESHADAGDHGNDALRVNGAELRARIVCEGGNLGMTQRGRVEFALAGGLCHTDFIDNSAGVDCSDREVNIKIALQALVQRGSLSIDARNTLLASLQDGVAHRVLSDNRQQALLLSVAVAQQPARHNEFADFITFLEHEAGLDRELEGLPDARAWSVRIAREQWLTRPELAVLLAYAKNDLKMRLTALNLADDLSCRDDLLRAFPPALCEQYHDVLMQHPLRHALVGTELANDFIHKLGITSLQRIQQRAGVSLADQVRAFVRVRDVFELEALWAELMSDQRLSHEAFGRMADQSMRYARLAVLWWTGEADLALTTADLDAVADAWSETDATIALETSEHLLNRFTRLRRGEQLLEVARLARSSQRPVKEVVQAYADIDEMIGFSRLLQRMHERTVTNTWQAHANEAYVEQWRDLHRQLCGRRLSGMMVMTDSARVEWQGLCSRLQMADYQEAGLYAVLTQKLHRLMHLPGSA